MDVCECVAVCACGMCLWCVNACVCANVCANVCACSNEREWVRMCVSVCGCVDVCECVWMGVMCEDV